MSEADWRVDIALPIALLIAIFLAGYGADRALIRKFGPSHSRIPSWVIVIIVVVIEMSVSRLIEVPLLWELVVVVCVAILVSLTAAVAINLKRL